jgi:polysaccharide biosynthesis transport protein
VTQPSPYFIQRNGPPRDENPEPISRNFSFLEEEEGAINLEQYWHAIRKRLGLILAIVFAAVMMTFVHEMMQTPLYTAEATVILKPGTPQMLEGKESQMDISADDAEDEEENFKKTQYEILKSRSLAATVVADQNLEHNPDFTGRPQPPGPVATLKSRIKSWLGMKPKAVAPAPSKNIDSLLPLGVSPGAVSAYLGGLRITPINETDLVKVGYVSPNPRLAAELANAHAHAYIRQGIALHSQANEEAERFLKERLAELKEKLEKSEVALNNYRRDKGIIPGLISLDGKETVVLGRLTELSKDLTDAQVQRISLESQMQMIRAGRYDALPQVVSDAGATTLKTQMNELDTQYAAMSKQFKDSYPPMEQLRAKREQIEAQYKAEIMQAVGGLQATYDASVDKEKKLQDEMNKERAQALNLNDATVEYAILQREVDTNRELYESVLERMKGVALAAEAQASNIVILDPAEVPGGPSSPQKMAAVMRTGSLAIGFALGLALLLDFLDNSLTTPDAVERYLHLPNIGVIPSFNSSNGSTYGSQRLANGTGRFLNGVSRIPDASSKRSPTYGRELIGAMSPYSLIGEAYRTFRTALMLSRAGAPPKLILFTSAHVAEGKTVTATNSAVMFAHTGARVCIVDADLRRPRCHRVLAMDNGVGLTEVLAGARNLQEVIHQTRIEGLDLLAAGMEPPNPTELVGSDKMREVLSMLTSMYDVVIVDSPPVLPVSDSQLLSTMVDGVVVVINSRKTSKQQVRAACTKLEFARAKIFGVVLNQVDVRHPDYKYYSHYYRRYSDRNEEDMIIPEAEGADPEAEFADPEKAENPSARR